MFLLIFFVPLLSFIKKNTCFWQFEKKLTFIVLIKVHSILIFSTFVNMTSKKVALKTS